MQLQCTYYDVKQISSFIYAFKGEIYRKLNNKYLGKPLLISKSFFDSFTFVYICLRLSTFFYTRLVIRLQSFSDSLRF